MTTAECSHSELGTTAISPLSKRSPRLDMGAITSLQTPIWMFWRPKSLMLWPRLKIQPWTIVLLTLGSRIPQRQIHWSTQLKSSETISYSETSWPDTILWWLRNNLTRTSSAHLIANMILWRKVASITSLTSRDLRRLWLKTIQASFSKWLARVK